MDLLLPRLMLPFGSNKAMNDIIQDRAVEEYRFLVPLTHQLEDVITRQYLLAERVERVFVTIVDSRLR
jgi:hypothetical protein